VKCNSLPDSTGVVAGLMYYSEPSCHGQSECSITIAKCALVPEKKTSARLYGVEVSLLHYYKRSRLCNVESFPRSRCPVSALTSILHPSERFFMHRIEGSSRNDGNKLLLGSLYTRKRDTWKRLKVKDTRGRREICKIYDTHLPQTRTANDSASRGIL
jgi:hypothetical protein